MSIFSRVYNALKEAFGTTTSTSTKITGYENYGYPYTSSEMKKEEYLKELKGWVAACVTAIADEIASIELKLLKFEGGEVAEVVDHEIINLLYKVNEYTTRFDHFWITQVYLELTGEAPWFVEKSGGKVNAVYFLRPDKLTPVTDKDSKLISGYKYDVGMGKSVPLALDEVIFLKYPDPMNPFRGKGTLEMAARVVDVDNFSEEWNKSFYKNAAKPDSVLKVKTDTMTDEQRIRLKQSLKEQYEGVEKAHKTMVLFGDMDWQQIGVNQKDMDFLEQQKFSRDKILGIFRVPKAVVAQTEGVNFASAEVAQYTFARWCIKPKIERLVQQLNEFLIPMFKNSDAMYLDYDNIVPEDIKTSLAKYQNGLQYGWLTVNEVREMENMEPVEGGDEIRIPGTPAPTEPIKVLRSKKINKSRIKQIHSRDREYFDIQNKKQEFVKSIEQIVRQRLEKKKKKLASIKTKECDHDHDENAIQPKLTTTEEKFAFWQMKDLIFNNNFPTIKAGIVKIFQEQYKEVVGKLNKAKGMVELKNGSNVYNKIKLNPKKEEERVLSIAVPLLEDLVREAGSKTYEAMGIDVDMSPKRDEIQKMILDYGREFAKSMNTTTNEAIKQAVYDNFSKGGTLTDLKNELSKYFDTSEQYRADRIARTETIRYSTAATEQAFLDSGVVKAKQWFVNPDACAICEPMKGKVVALNENYFDLGDTITTPDGKTFKIDYTDIKSAPLHVNCRCDLIPIWYDSAVKNEYRRLDISGKDTDIDRVRDVDNNITKHIEEKGSLKITKNEETSLEDYVSTGYKDINRYLRYGEYDSEDAKIQMEVRSKHISDIIRKNKVDEDYIVFRGAALEMSEKKLLGTFKPGSEIYDKGFVSTSFSESKAIDFATDVYDQEKIKQASHVVFRMKLATGSNAAIPFRSKIGISHEYEVLLDKESKFVIENVVKVENVRKGKDVYYIDVLYKGNTTKQLSNVNKKVSKKRGKSDVSRFVWTLDEFEINK